MTPAESESEFDALLRGKLADDTQQPPAHLWPAISQTLPVATPATPARGWWAGTAGVLGLVLGVLLGWWAAGLQPVDKGHFRAGIAVGSETKAVGSEAKAVVSEVKAVVSETMAVVSEAKAVGSEAKAVVSETMAVGSEVKAVGSEVKAVGSEAMAVGSETMAVVSETMAVGSEVKAVGSETMTGLSGATGVGMGALGVAAEPTPATAAPLGLSLWQTALAQDTALRQEAARAVAPVRPDSASRLLMLVAAQRVTLAVLQTQLDSLKAALPAAPPLLAAANPALAPAVADTLRRAPLPALRRWSAVLALEATNPWGVLPGAPDTREVIGGAHQVSLQMEHRLPNDRWLLRGGFGQVRLTSQFRHVQEVSGQTLVRDSVRVTYVNANVRTDTTRIIQLDSVLHLNPRINGSGQVIAYDSLWTPNNDTLYQVIITHDTVHYMTQNVRTRVETWRERREQQLRPTYRFWTIPVAVQYDVLCAGRWRAGVSAGAQVLLYRGADQPALTADGTYVLRRTGPRDGPFRPVSVALSTGLNVRYRLTDRLSLLAGAGGRGWVQSPVRGEARPKMQPNGQVGVVWGLGGR